MPWRKKCLIELAGRRITVLVSTSTCIKIAALSPLSPIGPHTQSDLMFLYIRFTNMLAARKPMLPVTRPMPMQNIIVWPK